MSASPLTTTEDDMSKASLPPTNAGKQILDFVFDVVMAAYVSTVEEAGPLPDRVEKMQEHTRIHYELMRQHDPRLKDFSDVDIRESLELVFMVSWRPPVNAALT